MVRIPTITALTLAATLVHAAVPAPEAAEAALRAADGERLTRQVDEDFRYAAADGVWLDRQEFLARTAQNPTAGSTEDVRVRLFDDVGLVHGTLVQTQGDGKAAKTRYTDVYRWNGTAWRLIAEQLSPLAAATPSGLIQEAAPSHAQWQGAYPSGSDEEILRVLNAGYVQAFLDSNVGSYDAHLAPDYLVVSATARCTTKARCSSPRPIP